MSATALMRKREKRKKDKRRRGTEGPEQECEAGLQLPFKKEKNREMNRSYCSCGREVHSRKLTGIARSLLIRFAPFPGLKSENARLAGCPCVEGITGNCGMRLARRFRKDTGPIELGVPVSEGSSGVVFEQRNVSGALGQEGFFPGNLTTESQKLSMLWTTLRKPSRSTGLEM